MTTKIQLHINATIDQNLLKDFIQHIRDFDVAHADCSFGVFTAAGDLSNDEMMGILKQITPPFPYLDLKRRN